MPWQWHGRLDEAAVFLRCRKNPLRDLGTAPPQPRDNHVRYCGAHNHINNCQWLHGHERPLDPHKSHIGRL